MFYVKQFSTDNKTLGILGEQIAAEHLKKQGYTILDKNFRYKGFGELDIVAEKSGYIAFVEVKARLKSSSNSNYNPEDNITYFKQKQLVKLAKIYLVNKKIPSDTPWQIDIIAVEIDPLTNKPSLRHLKQAIEDFY